MIFHDLLEETILFLLDGNMVFLKSDPTKIPTTLEEKTRGGRKLE